MVRLAKFLTGSEFDHVGIVLRDKEEGVPYVLEHGLDGQCALGEMAHYAGWTGET